MPSLAETLTQPLRTRYNARMDALENRPSEYGALNLIRQQTADPLGMVDAQQQEVFANSFGNTMSIPVIDYESVTIGNVRTCEVQTGGANSKLVAVPVFTLAFGFPMIPSQFVNNTIGYETLFQRQLETRIIAAAKLLDSKVVDYVNLNKNQFFPADMTKFFATVGGALQVPLSAQKDFYNTLRSISATQDFAADPDILTDPIGTGAIRQLMAQGTSNATNTAYQFAGMGEVYESNRVGSNAGVRSTLYTVADASLAMLERLDPDCREGGIDGISNGVSTWSTVEVPILGQMGSYMRMDCSNAGASLAAQNLQALTRARVESFEWSKDFAIFGSYNSDPVGRYAPYTKYELLNS